MYIILYGPFHTLGESQKHVVYHGQSYELTWMMTGAPFQDTPHISWSSPSPPPCSLAVLKVPIGRVVSSPQRRPHTIFGRFQPFQKGQKPQCFWDGEMGAFTGRSISFSWLNLVEKSSHSNSWLWKLGKFGYHQWIFGKKPPKEVAKRGG